MAEDNTWAGKPAKFRGALIRYAFPNPSRLITNGAAIDFTAGEYALQGGAVKFGANLNDNQSPTIAQMEAFKKLLFTSFREYIDGLGVDFARGITDEQIGVLGGTARALTSIGVQEFVMTANASASGFSTDERETGIDQDGYLRGLQQKAILNPDTYIIEKNADLKRIDEQSLTVFRESFNRYFNVYKYSRQDATKKALADRLEYKKLLERQHDLIYKTALESQAKKHFIKTGAPAAPQP